MALKRSLAASVIFLLAAAIGASPAQAEEPIDVTGQITDRANALGSDEAEVRRALDRFFDRTGLQLFVVYVPTFDDLTGAEWAARTSEKSGLGRADVLLVVATKDRAYGYDTDNATFTDEDLETIDRTRILPALRNDDFAGAAIEAADGYGDVAEDEGLPVGTIVLVGLVVLGVGALIVRRVRRRFDHTHRVLDEHGNPVDPAAILTLDELDTTASRALVAIDDALRTSEQELGFAEAQFGTQATAAFRTTLERGRELVREAFTLRQELDDEIEESKKERRAKASRIITICEQVDDELDAEVEGFDRLRDLQTSAPEVLQELGPRADAVDARLPTSREQVSELADHASVAGNIEQAERLITSAREQIRRGLDNLDDRPAAANHARAAEDALAQAVTLLDAIDEAEALEEKSEEERATLEDSLGRVTSIVKGVSEFIQTRRGAVGAEARTRLSEATRHLDVARRNLATDQDATRTALDAAERHARQAQRLADDDVEAWSERQAARDEKRTPQDDSMVLGGILVDAKDRGRLGNVLGGSSHGGGSGAPYGGSSHGSSSRTPGSFGGTSTRGRRRGGGRF